MSAAKVTDRKARKLGQLIREARENLDPPRKAQWLAYHLDTSESTVRNWERGTNAPSVAYLSKLLQLLPTLDPDEMLDLIGLKRRWLQTPSDLHEQDWGGTIRELVS
jgi:DNA-binding transcriptional regulator YiaG